MSTTLKTIDPSKQVQELYKEFIKNTYGDSPFPAHASAEAFFQYFFNTTLKLNDFKNLSGFLKRQDLKHQCGQETSFTFVETSNGVKHYRLLNNDN